jgi:hypothetical protein
MEIIPTSSAMAATGYRIRQIVAGTTCPPNALSRPAAGENRHEGRGRRAWIRSIAPIWRRIDWRDRVTPNRDDRTRHANQT